MLSSITDTDFDLFYGILSDSFPKNELRPKSNMQKAMKNEKYSVLGLYKDGTPVGVTAIWLLPDYLFIEYLAVEKSVRNNGMGAEILKELSSLYNKPLILEAEPPDNDMARRRIGFYERNGFYLNNYPYEQPAYSAEQESVPLMLMTTDGFINLKRFTAIKKTIYKEVYNKDI